MKNKLFLIVTALGLATTAPSAFASIDSMPTTVCFDIVWDLGSVPPDYAGSWTELVSSGAATYDAALLSNSGSETLTSNGGGFIGMNFTIAGNPYDETDDSGFGGGFPWMYFSNGNPTGFDFIAADNSVSIFGSGVTYQAGNYAIGGAIQFTDCPDPTHPSGPSTVPDGGSTAALLGLAVGGIGALARRRK